MRAIKKRNILLILLFTIIVVNCASTKLPVLLIDNPQNSKIISSPQFEITDFEVKHIKAVMDNEGQVHILAISKSPKRLYYIFLDKELTPKRQLVNIKGEYANLDLAIDSKGVLHSIFDNFHFVLDNGEWKKYSKCKCTKILRCGDYIACAFISEPEEIGRKLRIDWYTIGAGIIWPWPSIADKLIVTRHSGLEWKDLIDIKDDTTIDWTVIDHDTKLDISKNFAITADHSGALYVIYYRERLDMFHTVEELAYAKVNPALRLIDFSKDKVLRRLWTTSGKSIANISMSNDFDASSDPVTGNMIVIARSINRQFDNYFSLIINENNVGTPKSFLSGYCRGGVQVAATGRKRFHALFSCDDGDLWFLEYFNNKWSKPMKLGRVYNSTESIYSSGGENNRRDRFEILSDYNGNSMAIWINWDDSHLLVKLLEQNK